MKKSERDGVFVDLVTGFDRIPNKVVFVGIKKAGAMEQKSEQ